MMNEFKAKHRTEKEKTKIMKRLSIIAGQVNGVKEMVGNDRYCEDVLIQLAAISSSIKSVSYEIIRGHLSTCTKEELKKDNLKAVDNILNLFTMVK